MHKLDSQTGISETSMPIGGSRGNHQVFSSLWLILEDSVDKGQNSEGCKMDFGVDRCGDFCEVFEPLPDKGLGQIVLVVLAFGENNGVRRGERVPVVPGRGHCHGLPKD